jgi:signal transduction histidine kinase
MTPSTLPISEGPADFCDDPDFAERTLAGWHLLFAAMVAATAVLMAQGGHGAGALPVLAALVAAYVLLALRAIRTADTRFSVAYLAVGYSCMLVLEWQDPSALVLLFVLYPQGFVLLPRRAAIVATTVLTVAFSLVLVAYDGWTREAWGWHGLGAVGNLVFALVIGLFIDGIVRESRARKDLVVELRATRDELAAAERAAGAAEERERLARDIHDTLAQGFTSIVMLAQAGGVAAAHDGSPESERRFDEIQGTARENLAEARALVSALTPPPLASDGLPDALARLATKHEAETGTPVRFEVGGDPRPLAPSSEVAALRATQESLANARRHAGATHVEVVLTYDDDGATVTVQDDGRGFDPAADRAGYGLDGLVARAADVGGIAAVDSAPGEGTRVRVRVP